MTVFKVKNATREEIILLGGEDVPSRIRAWSVHRNGEILAIGGIRYVNDYPIAFCNLAPEAYHNKLTIWKAALIIFDKMKETRLPLVAVPDDTGDHPNSKKFLGKLGFGPYAVIGGKEVWKLRN